MTPDARRTLWRHLALVTIPLLLVVASGCSSSTSSSGSKINAVAGENFYGDLVSRVGGDLVSVTSILSDPNVDPHTYESSPANAQAVADATLVVENGLGYDAFLDHLIGASPRSDRKVIDVQTLLGLADGVNPHVWYDPATMPKVGRAVADAMEQLRPDSKPTIEANLKTYLDSFAPLAAKIAEAKTRYPGTPVAYTEPVPGYLVTALGWQALTPEGFAKAIEDGTDPAPADVAAMQDLLTGHKVKVLLYNSQATSPVTESIKTLAGQSGVPVVGVSETIPKTGESFVDWQLAQLNAIEAAIGGGA
ncbi:MAG: zinc ABC transporter substrate-binding protein [Candidatus Limnocylindrales bacterium]|jgi:zinc/manganese transport system substrate-binding protein